MSNRVETLNEVMVAVRKVFGYHSHKVRALMSGSEFAVETFDGRIRVRFDNRDDMVRALDLLFVNLVK